MATGGTITSGASDGAGRRGFTLIELLVVVAILAVLFAILAPSLRRARQMALRAACMSNMHQSGVAVMTYASDCGEYPPGCDASLPLDWFTAYGQGHFWVELLVAGEYAPSKELVSCTGGRRGYQWETWHAGDDGTDGHYYYGGPLTSGGTRWDIPQFSWPSGAGYQPQQLSLIRDTNVKVKSKGGRSLIICPTLFKTPWSTGYLERQPHGDCEWIGYWDGASSKSCDSYDRNCLFTDGRVETRYRAIETIYAFDGGWLHVPTPWMDGNYSAASPFVGELY